MKNKRITIELCDGNSSWEQDFDLYFFNDENTPYKSTYELETKYPEWHITDYMHKHALGYAVPWDSMDGCKYSIEGPEIVLITKAYKQDLYGFYIEKIDEYEEKLRKIYG